MGRWEKDGRQGERKDRREGERTEERGNGRKSGGKDRREIKKQCESHSVVQRR